MLPALDAGFESLWYFLLFSFTGRISQSQQSVFGDVFVPQPEEMLTVSFPTNCNSAIA